MGEVKRENKKGKRKRMRNIAIAGCVLVVGGILYSSFVQPYITYQHGKKLLSEKKYDDSIILV